MTHSPIHFTKMHGLGNDFVVINALTTPVDLHTLPLAQLSDRHLGIGFDQLLIIEPGKGGADFYCRILNADGSEAEQCGNGLRCVARFIHENKLHTQSTFTIATKAGNFPITIADYNQICVTLPTPVIEQALVNINIDNINLPISVLSTGNPHAILKVNSFDSLNPTELAPKITMQSYFPNGANVGFMQILNQDHIRLRTIERGVGETHACGSNACAAVFAGQINGWLSNQVIVEFRYGKLVIACLDKKSPINMTGPATKVFEGSI